MHTTATTLPDILLPRLTKLCVLNPINTSSMRKNNIRKTKTDKVDTYIICKILMMQDSLRFVSFYDLDLMDLKALGRFRQKTINQRPRLKIQLTSYVDEVFVLLQIRPASKVCRCKQQRYIYSDNSHHLTDRVTG